MEIHQKISILFIIEYKLSKTNSLYEYFNYSVSPIHTLRSIYTIKRKIVQGILMVF